MTIGWGNQREISINLDVNHLAGTPVFSLCFGLQWQQRYKLKGLILAQNERWRRGLGMQVVRG